MIYIIQSFSAISYSVNFYDPGTPDYSEFTLSKWWYPVYTIEPCRLDIRCGRSEKVILESTAILGKSTFSLPYRIRQRAGHTNNVLLEFFYSNTVLWQYIRGAIYATSVLTEEEMEFYGLGPLDLVNPSFPEYDVYTGNCPVNISRLVITVSAYWDDLDYIHFEAGTLTFIDSECPTQGLTSGNKYVIYNPETGRLVFNDATKLLTSANWQTGGEGSEISSSSVEYVWDGQGYVYLSGSKQTFSTIQFDDLLYVQAVHGETVRTIPFHLGERISQGGETVSRELTNITSILRAGKNTITLIAKNQDGTKVGFVTAVYVKRNMTAVSL